MVEAVNDAPSRSDIVRLEGKIDEIGQAIRTLIVVEERQTTQAREQAVLRADLDKMREQFWVEIEKLKELHAKTDARLSKWINVGVGAWGAVMVLWTVLEKFIGK